MVDFDIPDKKNWDYYDIKESETRALSPTEKFNIYPKKFPTMPSKLGWVLMALSVFDHNDMGWSVKMKGLTRDFAGEVSVTTLRALGLTVALPAQVWSPADLVIAFTPIFPGVPYRALTIDVVNYGTVAHNLLSWEVVLIPLLGE